MGSLSALCRCFRGSFFFFFVFELCLSLLCSFFFPSQSNIPEPRAAVCCGLQTTFLLGVTPLALSSLARPIVHPVWTRGAGTQGRGGTTSGTRDCAAADKWTPFTCTGSSDENPKRRGTWRQTHASVLTRPGAPQKEERRRERDYKEALNPCDKVQEKKVRWVVTDWRKMSYRSRNMINRLPGAKQRKMTVSQIRQEMGCGSWLIKRVYLLDESANCAKAAKRSVPQRRAKKNTTDKHQK